ncbi:MAG: Trk system potassium transporter TrkA [Kiritimatiellae bacterium]|nr:Trk system potassium transporter TrkA [Kiritimatiellia bacterium]
MRILIVGAGKTGHNLALKLCEMDHDVVVVDHNSEQLAALDAQLDVMTVVGSGSSPDVLEKAEVAKADLVVAVTSLDEANILACEFAHAAGVPHKVARVTNSAFARSSVLDFKSLGVDLMISQNEEVSREIFDILCNPGLTESVELLDGRLVIVGVRVRADGPLLRGALAEFQSDPMVASVRFVAVVRGERLSLPRGNTHFEVGDDIYVATRPEALPSFLDWMYPGRHAFEKTVVAGGGGLGLDIAQRLEGVRMPVVLLERDADRAGECSDVLHKTLVMHGDASDREMLVNAGVGPETAFVAITGDEELNIISCILAHKLGAAFSLAQVANPDYAPVVRSLGLLDRVVNPHQSMVNAILHFVHGRHVKAAAQLHRAPGELLHVAIREGHRWVGKPVHRLKMPGECVLATVLRDEQIHVPTGDLVIQAGDQLVIFSLPKDVERVQGAFKS